MTGQSSLALIPFGVWSVVKTPLAQWVANVPQLRWDVVVGPEVAGRTPKRSTYSTRLFAYGSQSWATPTGSPLRRLLGRFQPILQRQLVNRVVALVRKMFNLAQLWGIYKGDNPATGIELFSEEKRHRFVQPQALPQLVETFNAEPNPYVKTALLVALLSLTRCGLRSKAMRNGCCLRAGTFNLPRNRRDSGELTGRSRSCYC
jgi:hypothetical protein